jgi:low affinity Fe/Cu permease
MAPSQGPRSRVGCWLEATAHAVSKWTGSSAAFAIAMATVVLWGLSGHWFGYSDTWQLVINTGTTIVTFLMVFLIQRSQNKDSRALHLKLNEIVAGLEGASNRLINVEDLTEDEVRRLHEQYQRLVEIADCDTGTTRSHSIEEAAPPGGHKPAE